MRILIVDDEAGIRQVCERALLQAGHEVGTCATGRDALARLAEPWDLVVSDVQLGGAMDGNEVIRAARAAGARGVALMTAFPTVESAVGAVRTGACEYLVKPFALSELVSLAGRPRDAAPPPRTIEPRRLREATILFADVRGFTAYAEAAGPEASAALLDELLACFISAVHAEGGTINKLMGDGAMAAFGAPLPHADPAGAAVRAALRARADVERLGGLRFGFGVNTGLVAAGCLGAREGTEYALIGSAVNIAARLQEQAGAGQLLAGEGTLERLGPGFAVGERRRLDLKGLKSPVVAAEVLR